MWNDGTILVIFCNFETEPLFLTIFWFIVGVIQPIFVEVQPKAVVD
jgi:hypothetical protein